jgi:hypothetical protein
MVIEKKRDKPQHSRTGRSSDIIPVLHMQELFARVHPVTERRPQRWVPEVLSFGPTSRLFACFIGAVEL